jgi:hypothetical protein
LEIQYHRSSIASQPTIRDARRAEIVTTELTLATAPETLVKGGWHGKDVANIVATLSNLHGYGQRLTRTEIYIWACDESDDQ